MDEHFYHTWKRKGQHKKREKEWQQNQVAVFSVTNLPIKWLFFSQIFMRLKRNVAPAIANCNSLKNSNPFNPFYGFLCLPDNCFVDSHLHNGDNSVVAVEDVESVMQKIESSCRWVNLNPQFHQIGSSSIQNLNHHFVSHYQVPNCYKVRLQGPRTPLNCRLIFLSLLLSVPLDLSQFQDPLSNFRLI